MSLLRICRSFLCGHTLLVIFVNLIWTTMAKFYLNEYVIMMRLSTSVVSLRNDSCTCCAASCYPLEMSRGCTGAARPSPIAPETIKIFCDDFNVCFNELNSIIILVLFMKSTIIVPFQHNKVCPAAVSPFSGMFQKLGLVVSLLRYSLSQDNTSSFYNIILCVKTVISSKWNIYSS